jgi:CDP-glucose 4,6-dehydratase
VKGEIKHQYLSSEKARKLLGWEPGEPLEKRLSETVRWYRDYFDRLNTGAARETVAPALV